MLGMEPPFCIIYGFSVCTNVWCNTDSIRVYETLLCGFIFSFYLEIVIRNSTISYPLFLYMIAAIFKIRIINENPWFSFHIPIEERVAVNFLNLLSSQNQTMGPGWYFSQKNGFN